MKLGVVANQALCAPEGRMRILIIALVLAVSLSGCASFLGVNHRTSFGSSVEKSHHAASQQAAGKTFAAAAMAADLSASR